MKRTIKLSFIKGLHHAISAKNPLVQVIIGPRQVGKTTTVLHYLETTHKNKFHYVSADKVFHTSPQWVVEQWETAARERKILVIDEIQKCENWSETIKSLWDKSKRNKDLVQCILLGSSSLEIQKGLTESLTGRFQLHYVYHWNFAESKEGYDLSFFEYLKYGGYPGSYSFSSNEEEWQNYVRNSIVNTVVEKDILQFQNVKSPALFRQAFEILMNYPAQEISYTKLLGQIQDKGNTELVKYYIQLYEGAFLLKALSKFSPNKIKVKTSSPKILPLAPCLYYVNSLSPYSAEEQGRVLELLVGAQLVRTGLDLFYWREGKFEVDFVVKKGKRIWAVEVKSGRKKSTIGLNAFVDHFPNAKIALIDSDNYFEFEKNPMEFLEK